MTLRTTVLVAVIRSSLFGRKTARITRRSRHERGASRTTRRRRRTKTRRCRSAASLGSAWRITWPLKQGYTRGLVLTTRSRLGVTTATCRVSWHQSQSIIAKDHREPPRNRGEAARSVVGSKNTAAPPVVPLFSPSSAERVKQFQKFGKTIAGP